MNMGTPAYPIGNFRNLRSRKGTKWIDGNASGADRRCRRGLVGVASLPGRAIRPRRKRRRPSPRSTRLIRIPRFRNSSCRPNPATATPIFLVPRAAIRSRPIGPTTRRMRRSRRFARCMPRSAPSVRDRQRDLHGTDNRVVTDAIAQSGGAYRGIANVSDEMSDTRTRGPRQMGIRGCRFAFLKRLGGVGDMNKFNRIVSSRGRTRLACRCLFRAGYDQ